MTDEEEIEQPPPDAVWFTPEDAGELLHEWLRTYEGVRFATDFMERSHGRWKMP